MSEARAIATTLGEHHVPVTAFKWAMGHTLCASGVLDAVLATEALRSNVIPGIANLSQTADACAALDLSNATRRITGGSHALLINRGFGGMNVSLVMKACD